MYYYFCGKSVYFLPLYAKLCFIVETIANSMVWHDGRGIKRHFQIYLPFCKLPKCGQNFTLETFPFNDICFLRDTCTKRALNQIMKCKFVPSNYVEKPSFNKHITFRLRRKGGLLSELFRNIIWFLTMNKVELLKLFSPQLCN